MKTPLVKHLHFNDMTKYGKVILLGWAADIPDPEPHTKRYLQELVSITRSITDQLKPIYLEEYIKQVGRLR